MKNKIWLSFIFVILAGASWAASCRVEEQPVLNLMRQELQRSFKILKKQNPPIYYLSYTYTQGKSYYLGASYGGIKEESYRQISAGEVMARAGSEKMDSTRALRGERQSWFIPEQNMPLSEGKAFTAAWWRATQQAAEEAQKDFDRVRANVRAMASTRDQSDDFVFPPKSIYCQEEALADIDLEKIKPLLLQASKLLSGKSYVLDSNLRFFAEQGYRYFTDSRGTQLKTPYSRIRLSYSLYGRCADGLEINRGEDYHVFFVEELPTAEKLEADIKKSLAELEALSTAAEGEAFSAPTILKGKAAAVFVHEVMGHRLEGARQKKASDGQTLSGKVGQQVISPLITIIADPTMKSFNGEPLRGYYEYDDEGVAARPVVLIERGVLRNFLMPSSPIEGFPASNGHGRKEIGKRATSRMSVIRALASETIPYEQLEKQLVQEIIRQGKPFGFIVEDLGGGFTFTGADMPQSFKLETKLVYKVYPDGRKEPVRGLDVVGTPLVSFNRILAAGDDDAVFNGSCGAESGWVPQSNIAPSLLFENMEVQKTQKSDFKLPILKAPGLEGKK